MFTVKKILIGKCIACGKESECIEVESQTQLRSGLFCATDFKRQIMIVTANGLLAPPTAK